MGRIFWIIVALALGLATHISYVLFVPDLAFARQLNAATKNQLLNSFAVLDPGQQSRLVVSASPLDVVGLCKFDVSRGSVNFNARVPARYWTMTVYSSGGAEVYALNDAQAGSSDFTVQLSPGKSLMQQLFGGGDTEDTGTIENLGWHAEIVEKSGLAVLWVPVADASLRPEIEAAVAKSSCKLKAAG